MKKLFMLLFAVALFTACDDGGDNYNTKTIRTSSGETVYEVNGVHLHVVEIDGCEYLIGRSNPNGGYAGYGYLSHKGNCKYCEKRRHQ